MGNFKNRTLVLVDVKKSFKIFLILSAKDCGGERAQGMWAEEPDLGPVMEVEAWVTLKAMNLW